MRHDIKRREAIQIELSRLNQPSAYGICQTIAPEVNPGPGWMKLLPYSSMLVIAFGLIAIKLPIFFLALLVPVTLNVFVHYWHRTDKGLQYGSFSEINTLVEVASNINKVRVGNSPGVLDSIKQLKSLTWKLALLKPGRSAMQDDLSQFGYYLGELLNAIFLIEVLTVRSLEKVLAAKADAIKVLFDYVGWIDMSISIASLRTGTRKTCVPVLTEESRKMSAVGIYHP